MIVEDGGMELDKFEEDTRGKNDIAGNHPKKVKEPHEQLEVWLKAN